MQLLQGNCLELMKDIPDKSIDLVLCDLPYGVTAAEWDKALPMGELWQHYNRVVKDDGAVVLFSIQPFTTKLIESNYKDFRYCWYWKKGHKTGAQYARYQPMRCIEDICVFYKKHPTYNPQGLIKLDNPIHHEPHNSSLYRYRGNGNIQEYTNYPVHLLEFNSEAKRYHPTQKPVALLEYLIRTYTNKGDTVLDNTMGSGSVGVACLNTGRHFIGIELDEAFYNVACNRIYSLDRKVA